ncbi:hypothetical protein SUGI_0670360 [Cryptomeria japonica]|uniref:disease resistance protein RPV1-like n=1 Tax=Cryptomeria japonica TaxID=3369 RepID=UPI002414C2DA|nr:disease resistance protein RPV1-like [Cryptomeria japonica]GLJ33322.1 hypothetical protein SUGI_0670360 [Cryptomeria japonica]
MASSSSSHQKSKESNAFSGIEPAGKRRKVSESLILYDVFINHRGPDVKGTLATQFYNSLEQLGIRAFLDSQEKELGNSFPSTIETAIRSAKVHIAIFSQRYAESPWCLAELVLMLESKAKIIPVFCEVEPWELRHIERGRYADAFINHEKKGRYLEKLKEWKEALQSLSFTAGEEYKSAADCHRIVEAVKKEVQKKTCLHVAEYPVGLDNLVEDFERRCLDERVKDFERRCLDERVKDFEDKCGLGEGKHNSKVVGIFGMGGSGKTTLAKELFNRKSEDYKRASFLFDVREKSVTGQLHSLQCKLLKDLFDDRDLSFTSTDEGTTYLKDRLQRSPLLSFLIVVDDIDHVEQLNALRVMDFLNKSGNSLVIVTTRDVGVLIAAGITVGYNLKGMGRDDGRKLFCWHAFDQPIPHSGYEKVVDSFVDVCGGLPLSLQVLGRHVHGRAHEYWELELIKVRKTLPRDVKQSLRVSFDALDWEEKQIFMDIACFFVEKPKSISTRVWEGSGWNARHALETLKDRCLVEETEIFRNLHVQGELVFIMHDHLRDLGREMAHELSPPHRLWRPQDLKSLESIDFKTILDKTNIRCFHSIFDKSMGSQVTFFLGQPVTCLETSASLLWLQLEGNSREQPCIPSWIPLQNLQSFKIIGGRLKTFWENRIQEPFHLKELLIFRAFVEEFPDLLGESDSLENGGKFSSVKIPMSGFEKLENNSENFVSKILINGNHFPNLESVNLHDLENLMQVDVTNLKTLKCLDITNCKKLRRLTGLSDLTNLELLNICQCRDLEFEYLCLGGMNSLERITIDRTVKVKYFELDDCQHLKTVRFGYETLVKLSIRDCPKLDKLPIFRCPIYLEMIMIDGCGKFKYLELDGCPNLKSVSGNFELKDLSINDCPKWLPSFAALSCLEQIEIKNCEGIQEIMLPTTLISLSVQSCRGLKRIEETDDATKLTKLYISRCPELELPNLARLKCLQRIQIDTCKKLQILHVEDCKKLEILNVEGCKKLEIKYCSKMKNITLPTGLNRLSVKGCRQLKRVLGSGNLTKLTLMNISKCPELERLPNLDTCEKLQILYVEDCRKLEILHVGDCEKLEIIEIKYCEMMKNIALPTGLNNLSLKGCRQLKRVAGSGDLTKLTWMDISDCPELQELPSLPRMSCLEVIAIDSCEKLQNMTGFEELHASKFMKLSYCNSAVTRNCVHKLMSVPSWGMDMIGRAVDGADSRLNENMFGDANIGADVGIEIVIQETCPEWSELSAVIVCYLVIVDSCTPVESINESLSEYLLYIREGEWIITMVACDDERYSFLQEIEDVLRWYRVMKKGLRIDLKKEEEWKSVHVLNTIVNWLHHS